jgi:hypothetical protein
MSHIRGVKVESRIIVLISPSSAAPKSYTDSWPHALPQMPDGRVKSVPGLRNHVVA